MKLGFLGFALSAALVLGTLVARAVCDANSTTQLDAHQAVAATPPLPAQQSMTRWPLQERTCWIPDPAPADKASTP